MVSEMTGVPSVTTIDVQGVRERALESPEASWKTTSRQSRFRPTYPTQQSESKDLWPRGVHRYGFVAANGDHRL
jgi:hypothetical protein